MLTKSPSMDSEELESKFEFLSLSLPSNPEGLRPGVLESEKKAKMIKTMFKMEGNVKQGFKIEMKQG